MNNQGLHIFTHADPEHGDFESLKFIVEHDIPILNMKVLLNHGASVHVVENNGHTPLSCVISIWNKTGLYPYVEKVRLLIKHGARLADVKIDGYIPKWIYSYEHKVKEYRQKERDAGIAFLFVCRKNKVPKDLARDVLKRMILSKEFLQFQRPNKKKQK